jgi:glutaredoxin
MLTRSICVLILALTGMFSPLTNAEVYRYVDESGRVVYTSVKPDTNETVRKVTIRNNSVASMEGYDEIESKDVVMYSASWCGICKKARAYFEAQSIDFNEYDVDKDPRGKREFSQLGGRGVPLILVGDQRMNGFSQKRFEHLYSAEN